MEQLAETLRNGGWELFTLLLSAGIISTLLKHVLEAWRDHSKARQTDSRSATYLAIQLVTILERFAIQCRHVIAENDYDLSQEGDGRHRRLPELQPYPDVPEWRVLDSKLASQAQSLRNEVYAANVTIEHAWEVYGDAMDAGRECRDQASWQGYRAWEIAKFLRDKYGLGAFSTSDDSNFLKVLKPHPAKVS